MSVMLRLAICCAIFSCASGFNGASVLDRIPVFVDAGGFAIEAPVDPTSSDLLTEDDAVAEPSGVLAVIDSSGATTPISAVQSLHRQTKALSHALQQHRKGERPNRALHSVIRQFMALAKDISSQGHRQHRGRHTSFLQKPHGEPDSEAESSVNDSEGSSDRRGDSSVNDSTADESTLDESADSSDRRGNSSVNESTAHESTLDDSADSTDRSLGSSHNANESITDEHAARRVNISNDMITPTEREFPELDPMGDSAGAFNASTVDSMVTSVQITIEQNLTIRLQHEALRVAAICGKLLISQDEFHEANDTLVDAEANASQAQEEADATSEAVDADHERLDEAVSKQKEVSKRRKEVEKSVAQQRKQYDAAQKRYRDLDGELLKRTQGLENSTSNLNQSKKSFVEANARYNSSKSKEHIVVTEMQAEIQRLEQTNTEMVDERADLRAERASKAEKNSAEVSLSKMPKAQISPRLAARAKNMVAIRRGTALRSSPCNSTCQIKEQSGEVSKKASDEVGAVDQSTTKHQEKLGAETKYSEDVADNNAASEAVNRQIIEVALAHEDCEQKKRALNESESELTALEREDAYWQAAIANFSAELNESKAAQHDATSANVDAQKDLSEAQMDAAQAYAQLIANQEVLQRAIDDLNALNEELLQVQSDLYDGYDAYSDLNDSDSNKQDSSVDKTAWVLVFVGLAVLMVAAIAIVNLRIFNGM